MTISSEAYSALEAVVGRRYVSKDPGIIVGYAWNTSTGANPQEKEIPSVIPVAVVLPSTTEEVASIVKVCNKHGLKHRAHSVGWSAFHNVSEPNTVTIDLRRMNRIHEIDERNMVAVIEPFVTAGQLMAEAMKKGMTCHVVGAGPTHSPLASATSGWGGGISSASTGHNARNLLALEWVTPEGEIVRIGSSGSGLGWFGADGPGPGFRGMLRGASGAVGGLGVYTRIGYKLYPWYGPKQLQPTGQHPQIGIKIGENNVRFFHGVWPSWDAAQQAAFELNRSGVATVMMRMPPSNIGWTLTETNSDYVQLVNSNKLPEIARPENGRAWSLVTTAYCKEQDAYNQKVVRTIVDKTQGRLIDVPQEHAELLARALVTSCYVPRVMRPTGFIGTGFGVLESFHLYTRTIKATQEVWADQDVAKKNFCVIEGETEQNWMWTTERRHFWTENIEVPNKATKWAMMRTYFLNEHVVEKKKVGISAMCVGPMVDMFGPESGPDVNSYMRQIKNTYDPHDRCNSFWYITAKASPANFLLPIIKPILFARPFRLLLNKFGEHFAKANDS